MVMHAREAVISPSFMRSALPHALLLLCVLVLYLPVYSAGFIWDDDSYVVDNVLLHDVEGLRRIWIPGETPQYYPIVFVSFWIEYQIWELDPRGYHVVNVVLHAINACLVALVMQRLRVPGAFLIGVCFGVHPIMVESVAWITERKNVLSMTFFLSAAMAYLAFQRVRDGEAPSRRTADAWGWYGLSLGLFALALLSKTVTCSLPAALILAMLWLRQSMDVRRLAPLVPMFAMGIALAAITVVLERTHVGASGEDFSHGLVERTLIACRALLFYPWLMLWPSPLMFIHPRWDIDTHAVSAYLPLLAVTVIAAGCIPAWRRGLRGPVLAICLYAGMIFPAIGFFNVYPHIFSFVAEHFVYHASIGVFAFFVGGAVFVVRKTAWNRAVLMSVTAVVLAALSTATYSYARVYVDAETLYRDTIAKNPNAWMPRNNLASELLRQAERLRSTGDERLAVARAEEAAEQSLAIIAIRPSHHTAWSNLSEARRFVGDVAGALVAIREAVSIHPGYPDYHWMEGRLAQLSGDPHAATEAFDHAISLLPDVDGGRRPHWLVDAARARLHGAETTQNSGAAAKLLDRSIEDLLQAIALVPEHYDALALLARAYLSRGDEYAAFQALLRALPVAPGEGERIRILTVLVRQSLESDDERVRSPAGAGRFAEELVRLTGGSDPAALSVLAMARIAQGDLAAAEELLDLAIVHARRREQHDVLSVLLNQKASLDARRLQEPEPADSGR